MMMMMMGSPLLNLQSLYSAERRGDYNSPRGAFISPVPLLLFLMGFFLAEAAQVSHFLIFPEAFNHVPVIPRDCGL